MSHVVWDDPHYTWDSSGIDWEGLIVDSGLSAWFTPPAVRAPLPPQRVAWSDETFGHKTPASGQFRRLVQNLVSVDVIAGGVTYPGGRWTGPLTDVQVSAIEGAGYGEWIVYVASPDHLPTGPGPFAS